MSTTILVRSSINDFQYKLISGPDGDDAFTYLNVLASLQLTTRMNKSFIVTYSMTPSGIEISVSLPFRPFKHIL